MKALVVYESMFGNTAQVARSIADGLAGVGEVTLAEVRTMPPLDGVDLLVVGGPTHAFGLSRPGTRADAAKQGATRDGTAPGVREYLAAAPRLDGLPAAAFDTKIDKPAVPGSAARGVHRRLRRLGCRMLCPAESFRVTGTPGPLAGGEAERARRWAADLAAHLPAGASPS